MSDALLVERVVRAVLAELSAEQAPCACHATPQDCCPDRFGRLLGEGAARFGRRAGGRYPDAIARLIDHTLLKPDATHAQIEALCREALEHGFATVCVNPTWVSSCARLLHGSQTGVCTVVGFPLGATEPQIKAMEARRAIRNGAREIDMVINVGALKSGNNELVMRDIRTVPTR